MITRRNFLAGSGAAALAAAWPAVASSAHMTLPIPATGETIPVIGMGTYRTFNLGDQAKPRLLEVLKVFFDHGGQVLDSSPMYGKSEQMVGELLQILSGENSCFAATKVWTQGKQKGIEQMKRSMKLIGVDQIDLMQIHNMKDWRTHIRTLRDWKNQGLIRYVGLTTSNIQRFGDLAAIMRSERPDFVQFNYSLGERQAESKLLPLAQDLGIATMINRPFMAGQLFRRVGKRPLPSWATEFDCTSWAQFFLKFIVSHPSVTCVIPATSKPHNMKDNMAAGFGAMPDASARRKMFEFFQAI